MKDPSVQLWAEDEVHFQRHTSVTRMWSVKGKQPHVLSASTRQKIGFFGAINLKTGRLLTQEAVTFNADTFASFLGFLLKHTRGKIFIIIDNARWHRARDLKDFFTKNEKRLVRIFLPPYSPQLNPIERVWRITRRQATHNRYFGSVEHLRIALASHFENWQKPNEALKILCANI
ncbi:MAG: IS630 family transposase [Deltaproteobacteria bacterium]|nr:MAG: IS630 family transposase [Deltaproteobacteria bacterium]